MFKIFVLNNKILEFFGQDTFLIALIKLNVAVDFLG